MIGCVRVRWLSVVFVVVIGYLDTGDANAETLRHPLTLEQQLKRADPAKLATEVRLRGDARRGAVLFYTSAAACVNCHAEGKDASALGPPMSELRDITALQVIESLLFPSKSIRKGYETHSVLTVDGEVFNGMLVSENESQLVLRAADNLSEQVSIQRDDVEVVRKSDRSMMPEGLIATFAEQRDFLDLVAYIVDAGSGGLSRINELKPPREALVVPDDTLDLDHEGIIRGLGRRDLEAGRAIYQGYCFNCHGTDGNTPSLPTARAFGTQPMRFGSDPYRMFMTLSKGNGLMAPMNHLTPKERYQVVHYIREQLMKSRNPAYFRVTPDYLKGLPQGAKQGTEIDTIVRNYGPALASQLRREFSSVLSVKLDNEVTLAYNLHRMDQASIWRNGFLDLSETQHQRDRGEGTADPDGEPLDGLAGWRWGHDGTLDYPTKQLLPRGPMPKQWLDYHGHYMHDNGVVLGYAIDGREILEYPHAANSVVSHTLQIGPGKALLLCVAAPEFSDSERVPGVQYLTSGSNKDESRETDGDETSDAMRTMRSVSGRIPVLSGDDSTGTRYVAAGVRGEIDGLLWDIDSANRIVLRIPARDRATTFEVLRTTTNDDQALQVFTQRVLDAQTDAATSPSLLTHGGRARWPDVIKTVGTLGLGGGGYALDTLTLPDRTPWNTWFRTSALDFFPDGRMVVATYGGDVWVVSGVNESLLDLRWNRFAAGLYEPFGVKVVDDTIYVTCKDRITRLHDLNADGEADFYESFSADTDVSVNFHAFNFDLQVDQDGNFYYAKSGHGSDSDIPGCVIKVSPDGKKREIYCTGFRTPNGMGMLPGNRPTTSDNQGQWTPASKISQVRAGGFYGWVPTYSIPGKWEPGGGSIDVKQVVPPESFDPPIVWMPQEFDNSSGGQLWVDDPRWGPLAGRMLHTSFGKGWMSYMMLQEIDGVSQAAIIKLPFNFRTGIMRARVNPGDGQVYATGLQGWNGGGRAGLLDGGIQRLRYTGSPINLVSDCRVEPDGLRIEFNFELDPVIATNHDSYTAEQWNYQWRRQYGSDQYSPRTGKVGIDAMNVEKIVVHPDRKSVKLVIPDLIPVDQVHLVLRLKTIKGEPFTEEIYWTLNGVP